MPEDLSLTEDERGPLSAAIEAGRYTFFVGAGVSTDAGLPTASQLVETLLKALYRRAITASDAEELFRENNDIVGPLTLGSVAQAIGAKIGRPRLIALIKDSVSWEVSPDFVHGCLAKISLATKEREQPLRVITSNYDTLIEDAFGSGRDVVVTQGDFQSALDGRPWILKIHGCIRLDPENIIITEDDLASELPDWKREGLRQSTRGRGMVVLGYSGMDEHLNSFIWRGIEESERSMYPSYWVGRQPLPRPAVEQLVGYGGRPLLMDAVPFFEQLGFAS